MTVHNLLVEQALVLMESTTSLVTVLDLDTLDQHVMWTLMNVKLKNLVILMLLVLTTKAHTSVTVNQDLTERIATRILMIVEATHVKMEVCHPRNIWQVSRYERYLKNHFSVILFVQYNYSIFCHFLVLRKERIFLTLWPSFFVCIFFLFSGFLSHHDRDKLVDSHWP